MSGIAPNDVCIFEAPKAQFAIDLIDGWTCAFPSEANVKAGQVQLFSDPRATWAFSKVRRGSGKFGVQNMRVLELGPLEGAHTYMLSKAGAASITAIEANKRLFLKCLITKEVLGIANARFLLGDFMPWLEATSERFDLVWSAGVLYHMPDPLRLLNAIARVTDRIHIWTHYVDPSRMHEPWASPIVETVDREVFGRTVKHYKRTYNDATKDATYCGGVYDSASWIAKADILEQLRIDGFRKIDVSFDTTEHPNGPCFALVAQR